MLTWSLHQHTGCYDLVLSSSTPPLLGQQYTLPLTNPLSLSHQLSIYKLRSLNNQYMVRVHQVQHIETNSLCSGGLGYLRVIIERIPFRLNEVENLTQSEAIYIFYQCLKGFESICEMMGPVIVEKEMVGIDENGRVKVWGNQEYSRNQVERKNRTEMGKGGVVKMVESILNAVGDERLPKELVKMVREAMSQQMKMQGYVEVVEKWIKERGIDIQRVRVKVKKEQEITLDQQQVNSFYVMNGSGIQGIPNPVAELVHKLFSEKIKLDEQQIEVEESYVVVERDIRTPDNKEQKKQLFQTPQINTTPPEIPPIAKHVRPLSQPSNISNSHQKIEIDDSPLVLNRKSRPVSQKPVPQHLSLESSSQQFQGHQVIEQFFQTNTPYSNYFGQPTFQTTPVNPLQVPQLQHFQRPSLQNSLPPQLNPQAYIPESICYPLSSPQLTPQQYQKLILQQLNARNRVPQNYNQPTYPQMYPPVQYQNMNNFPPHLPFNANLIPQQMNFINTAALQQQYHMEQQYLQNQIFNYQNGLGRGIGMNMGGYGQMWRRI